MTNARFGRILLFLLVVCTARAFAVQDYDQATYEPLYIAEPIFANRLTSQYTLVPPNETWIHVRHMGDSGTEALSQQIANRVDSDRSAKTGLELPNLPYVGRWMFQRGFIDDPEYGLNVYQVFGRAFGWHINTFQFSHALPIECPPAFPDCRGGPNIAYGRRFYPGLDAWKTRSSEFTLQVYLKLPWVHYEFPAEPGVAQVSLVYIAQHEPTGQVIGGIINLFDTRPRQEVGWECAGFDGILGFVSSDLRDTQPDGSTCRYVTRSPDSSTSQNRWRWEGERFFRAHVSWENFENVLYDTQSPGIPSEYRVIESAVLIEVFPRLSADVSIAGSLRNFELYRVHDD